MRDERERARECFGGGLEPGQQFAPSGHLLSQLSRSISLSDSETVRGYESFWWSARDGMIRQRDGIPQVVIVVFFMARGQAREIARTGWLGSSVAIPRRAQVDGTRPRINVSGRESLSRVIICRETSPASADKFSATC